MSFRLTLTHPGEDRELVFDRREVSIGSGPFNDVVVEADDVPRVAGVVEVEGEQLVFRCRVDDGCVALIRDDERIDSESGGGDQTHSLEVGDALHLDESGEVVLTLTELETGDEGQPFETLPLPSDEEFEPEAELAGAVWRATRSMSRAPGVERLLRVIGALVGAQFDGELNTAVLTLADEHGRGANHVYQLDFDGADESVERDGFVAGGTYERRRAPLVGLGVERGRLVARLRDGEHFAIHPGDDGSTSLFYPIGVPECFGILECRFPADRTPPREELERLGATIQPIARLAADRARERLDKLSFAEENRYFRERERRQYLFKDLVSESEAMSEVYEKVDDWVGREDPVLIVGEAGCGKSLVARAFHHLGPREDGMLIRLDCRALSEEVLESELFGCVESELVGAVAPRKGVFELADQGTVFLDEIDHLAPYLQRKLLRVVNEQEVRRIGDAVGRPVDTRLIASTHRDLGALVERGSFRRDLYLRLRDHVLEVPALRERREDILPLARVFLQKFANRYERACREFGDRASERLQSHTWPGNVRELKTVVESAVLKTDDDDEVLEADHLDF